jgi:hypothetical protein
MSDVLRDEPITVFPSAARTATPASATYRVARGNADGLIVVIDATAVTSTPSVVFTIVGVDEVSGKTWTVLASAAVTTVSTTVLRVNPSLTGVTNQTAKDLVPTYFRVTAVHGNANSITYSVAAYLV